MEWEFLVSVPDPLDSVSLSLGHTAWLWVLMEEERRCLAPRWKMRSLGVRGEEGPGVAGLAGENRWEREDSGEVGLIYWKGRTEAESK